MAREPGAVEGLEVLGRVKRDWSICSAMAPSAFHRIQHLSALAKELLRKLSLSCAMNERDSRGQ